MDQHQTIKFIEENIHRGVQICLLSWPTLNMALDASWISQNRNVSNNERIASFKKMSSYQLRYALIKQLQTFIMKHQVEQQHLTYWFTDIMDDVFCADVEDCFIQTMAKQLVGLVQDLQQGNTLKIKQFQDAYDKMKESKCKIDRLQGNNSSDSAYSSEFQSQSEQEEEQKNEQLQQPPKLVELTEEEKALEDDGWTIIKKKK